MLIRRASHIVLCLTLFATLGSAAQIPRRSPEFAINMENGSQILLSQYHGKVVVLAFILTYCPHCQYTTKILTKMQNEYGPRGFQVLASAIEDMAKMMVPDFVKKFQPSFPVGFNDRATVLQYLQHPAMFRMMMPQLVFIDKHGMIRAQYAGDNQFFGPDQEKNIQETIESLLKEGASHERTSHRSRKKA